MRNERKELKEKILEQMVADYYNSLDKNFELAKKFIRVTRDGKVDVLFKEELGGKEQILLYLIGKIYSKEAELTSTDCVNNKELAEELGVPDTSLRPWLKDLRDKNKIVKSKEEKYTCHSIPANLVEKTLKEIDQKIKIN
jgi:hypothetical protein